MRIHFCGLTTLSHCVPNSFIPFQKFQGTYLVSFHSSDCGVMEDRVVELKEVEQHRSEDDLWIIIDGKVYDVTPYVTDHPGGKAILRNAGADASRGFHSQKAHGIVKNHIDSLLKNFCVGKLCQS